MDLSNLTFKGLVFILLISAVIPVVSQEYSYPCITTDYAKSVVTDSWNVFRSPVEWKAKSWTAFGLVSVTGLVIAAQDLQIRNWVQEHRSPFGDDLEKYGLEPWGKGIYSAALLGGLYFGGRLSGNDRASATALTAGKAAIISSFYVQVIKQLTHRHRPYQDNPADPGRWDGPLSSWKYNSFPSGHSALAFSVATVLASEYRETIWVPLVAYTLAAGTALSRIYIDKHWASDAFAGAVFGYVCGRFIWKQNCRITIIPALSNGVSSCNISISIK